MVKYLKIVDANDGDYVLRDCTIDLTDKTILGGTLTVDAIVDPQDVWVGEYFKSGGFPLLKVVDRGRYELLDENFTTLYYYSGYVPQVIEKCLNCNPGWGDYIDFQLDLTGKIVRRNEAPWDAVLAAISEDQWKPAVKEGDLVLDKSKGFIMGVQSVKPDKITLLDIEEDEIRDFNLSDAVDKFEKTKLLEIGDIIEHQGIRYEIISVLLDRYRVKYLEGHSPDGSICSSIGYRADYKLVNSPYTLHANGVKLLEKTKEKCRIEVSYPEDPISDAPAGSAVFEIPRQLWEILKRTDASGKV